VVMKMDDVLSVDAMIAVSSPVLPHPSTFLQQLVARCPDVEIELEGEENENTFTFTIAGNKAIVALVTKQIPWTDLEEQCAVAWWWPEATQTMQAHTAHVLVAILGDNGSALERYVHLTHLTAVVTEKTESLGVLFGSGSVVHPAKAFVSRSEGVSQENVDPLLWIDMRVEQNDDGSLRFYSLGMTFLGMHELEIDSVWLEAEELLDFAYSTIAYILASGEVIMEGETIGRSEDEVVVASYVPSMWNSERTVLKLGFSS
jgi:hypothetical protein